MNQTSAPCSIEELDELLTRPGEEITEFVSGLESPLVILGAGGKMGPTLSVLARRAADAAHHVLEVIAVSRFSNPSAERWLNDRGVRTVRCDLLRRHEVLALPEAANVIYMVGRKFGTDEDPALTWAMNVIPPQFVLERYPSARIVAMSTGNVYEPVPISAGGSIESDPVTPRGEYANACVARERVFEYCSRLSRTELCQIRLNYAVELRYGILVDIACRVYEHRPVPLEVGYVNCIWQADANASIIRSLGVASHPQRTLNLTGPVVLSVRRIAERFGELLDREVRFDGSESEQALLNNPASAIALFGLPETPIDQVIAWTAEWISEGRPTLDRPTHFERVDGKY